MQEEDMNRSCRTRVVMRNKITKMIIRKINVFLNKSMILFSQHLNVAQIGVLRDVIPCVISI